MVTKEKILNYSKIILENFWKNDRNSFPKKRIILIYSITKPFMVRKMLIFLLKNNIKFWENIYIKNHILSPPRLFWRNTPESAEEVEACSSIS